MVDQVHFSSSRNEYCTPSSVIWATEQLFGAIDLDPCAFRHENGTYSVPAKKYFLPPQDGLAQEWYGKVYMNPPYGREISRWIDKLCFEYRLGYTLEAIALVPARIDTQWWQKLRDYPVCLVKGRLKFVGMPASAPFPSAIFYLGLRVQEFVRIFTHTHGDVWMRMEAPSYD